MTAIYWSHPSLIAAWVGHFDTLESEFELDFRNPRNEAVLQEMDSDSRRAIAIDSRDARSWYARAVTLAFLGRFDAAFEANDRARALDPSRFSGQRSWLYVMSGQAAKTLEEIGKRDPQANAIGSCSSTRSASRRIRCGSRRSARISTRDCERPACLNDEARTGRPLESPLRCRRRGRIRV